MKKITLVFCIVLISAIHALSQPKVRLENKPDEMKVDVLVDGKLFTSYLYSGTLKKPVLWPVISPGGNEVTRQFPFKNKAGERVDHVHHVGIWLNYGDVNGFDFWNNGKSETPPEGVKYGTIYHEHRISR